MPSVYDIEHARRPHIPCDVIRTIVDAADDTVVLREFVPCDLTDRLEGVTCDALDHFARTGGGTPDGFADAVINSLAYGELFPLVDGWEAYRFDFSGRRAKRDDIAAYIAFRKGLRERHGDEFDEAYARHFDEFEY